MKIIKYQASAIKIIHGIFIAFLAVVVVAPSSHATWGVVDAQADQKSFVITHDELVAAPQDDQVYAVIEYGVITKIFYWTRDHKYFWPADIFVGTPSLEDFANFVLVTTVPSNFLVAYDAGNGEVKAEAINHSDRVRLSEHVETVVGTPIPVITPVPVIAAAVNEDFSTSITVKPAVNTDTSKTVGIEVIANGLSYTAVRTDNSSTPITISNLPQDSLVTVQTTIRDIESNSEQVTQNALVHTPKADLPILVNARDVAQDTLNIAPPQSQVAIAGDAKSVTISFGPIANLDSTKSLVSIEVVGPGGSSTSIGVGGNGGSVTVSDLGAALGYTVKMVIRDLDTGEETIIRGNSI